MHPFITADRASRLLTAMLALLLAATPVAAQTITPQIGGGIGFSFDGGISGKGVPTAPPSSGSALLADNTNPGLLADNVNPACLAGGC